MNSISGVLQGREVEKLQIDEAMQQGIMASEAGDKDGAYSIFQQLVAQHPGVLEAWVWMGWTSPTLEEAEAAFQRANALDPNNEEATMGLRWVESQREATEEEPMTTNLDMLNTGSLTTSPPPFEMPAPSATMSTPTLSSAQTSTDHLTSTLRATMVPDWNFDEEMQRGLVAAQSGDKAAAYDIFQRIAARQPDNAEVWVWLGGTASSLDDAEAAFKQALAIDPSNEKANLGLRWAALRKQTLRTISAAGSNPFITGPLSERIMRAGGNPTTALSPATVDGAASQSTTGEAPAAAPGATKPAMPDLMQPVADLLSKWGMPVPVAAAFVMMGLLVVIFFILVLIR